MEKITQTEWAREIGVSKQYVCYLVKKGIIELENGLVTKAYKGHTCNGDDVARSQKIALVMLQSESETVYLYIHIM